MRKLILISSAVAALALPAQALAHHPSSGAPSQFRGSIYFNPLFHTLGPNGEVVAHFNHAQRLYLIPY